MAKTLPVLVFLTEQDADQKRVLDSAGLPRLQRKSKSRELNWFQDERKLPKHTANYVKRLGQLRKDLLHQEHDGIQEALERFQEDNSLCGPKQRVVKPWESSTLLNRDTYPYKHKELQHKKAKDIERHKRGAVDTSKSLEPIQGEKLTDIQPQPTPSPRPSKSSKLSTIPDVIAAQQARLSRINHVPLLTPTGPRDQLPPSVPNKYTKSRDPGETEQQYGFQKSSNSVPQIRQLHQKDSKGLYRGQQHPLSKSNKSEVDLSPDSHHFDALEESRHLLFSRPGSKVCSVPRSTPVPTADQNSRNPRSLGDITGRHAGERTTNAPGQYPNTLGHFKPLAFTKNPLLSQALPPTLLRTTTSLYAPTRQGYIRIARQKPKQPVVNQEKHSNIPETKSSSHSKISNSDEALLRGSPSQAPRIAVPMEAQLSEHPDTISIPAENGEMILVNQTNTELGFEPQNSVIYKGHTNTPQHSGTMTPTDANRDKQMNLVVEMPDIILKPPSPHTRFNGEQNTNGQVVSLRKTFRQNEMREKEISNLLQDVRELNEVTQQMENDVNSGTD